METTGFVLEAVARELGVPIASVSLSTKIGWVVFCTVALQTMRKFNISRKISAKSSQTVADLVRQV